MMSRQIFIAIFLTISNFSFGQIDTIKYKQFGDSIQFSELNLCSNNTFQYHHYNIHSCWTWYSVNGSWERLDDSLILIDTFRWEEDNVKIDTTSNNQSFVLITVKNDRGKYLEGIKVDFYSFWSDSSLTYVTDKNGQIKINKETLKNQENKKSRYLNYVFEINFSNQKCKKCSMRTSFKKLYDQINVTLADNPKEEKITRTTIYKIENDTIYFNGQTYTGDKGFGKINWGNYRRLAN